MADFAFQESSKIMKFPPCGLDCLYISHCKVGNTGRGFKNIAAFDTTTHCNDDS